MKISNSSLIYFERNNLYRTLPFKRLVLNIGCGSGSFPKFYPYPNSFIVNIDISEEKAGYPAYGLKYKTFEGFLEASKNDWRFLNLQASALDLYNFPDKLFEMVVCGQVIEHFDMKDIELILSEIYRILDDNGIFQCDTITDRYEKIKEHKISFTLDSLEYLFTRFNFSKKTCFEFGEGKAIWAVYTKKEVSNRYGDTR